MKARLFLILIISLFCTCLSAQKITGKWRCTKESIAQIHMRFDYVTCTYRFKKNGKMIIKIKGDTYVSHKQYTTKYDHHRRGTLVIKGSYSIQDGKITSIVAKEDIEASAIDYCDHSLENDRASVANSDFAAENRSGIIMERAMSSQIMTKPEFWNWDQVPITISNNEVKIGEAVVLKR